MLDKRKKDIGNSNDAAEVVSEGEVMFNYQQSISSKQAAQVIIEN